ncbi:protein of unknown function [Shewanella benthica]|uniref:Uncharacterized protein n=1 Tax=Shewanella benthica TaxID=43661 RepID=A0A330M3Q2_9GAMM|nr:protein of unknown function [Shewanella benthica]
MIGSFMFLCQPKLFGLISQFTLELMLTSFGMPAESDWILQM